MVEQQEEDVARFIPPPPSEDLVIWRYVDFTKFLAMLNSQALFFARVATLDDPFEGSFPPAQSPLKRIQGAFPPGLVPHDAVVHLSPGLDRMWEIMRYWAMVNCWHESPYESAAMWRLYSSTTGAVAIKSTVRQLRKALGRGPEPPPGFGGSSMIHIGMIDYIDFRTQSIPDGSFAAQFYRKRKSFEHERELRAMLLQFPLAGDRQRVAFEERPQDRGLLVTVDLHELVEEIRIAPQAPRWYANLVKDVARKYSLDVPTTQSELDAIPVY